MFPVDISPRRMSPEFKRTAYARAVETQAPVEIWAVVDMYDPPYIQEFTLTWSPSMRQYRCAVVYPVLAEVSHA